MSADPIMQGIAASHAGIATRLAGGPAWNERRGLALSRLLGRGLPDRRDENWKYLDHAEIAGRSFSPAATAPVTALQLAPVMLPLAAARRVVLVDGACQPGLSAAGAGNGIEIDDLAAIMTRDPALALQMLREPGDDADDRYALLAEAFVSAGVVIRVAANAAPGRSLYLLHVGTGTGPGTNHSRVVIEVGAGATLSLVEHFVTLGNAPTLANLAAELRIDAGATVEHLRIHESGAQAAQLETWVTTLQADSRYRQQFFALGGRLLRSNLDLSLAGRAAAARLSGLFMVDGARQADLYTRVEHHGAVTRTSQEFRGIGSGRGRGAFNGRVVVHPSARGADASQTCRNLLLTPLAEINTRPQLEIHTDDVQCRHGATTGTLDPEQIFYLRSRGLDAVTARALLTVAFCADIVAALPQEALREYVLERVVGQLPDRDVIRSLR